MGDKLQVGVIGAGWWSTEHHLPGVLSYEDAELAALCDPDEARLAAAAGVYPPRRTYTDYREMLAKEKLDCALVVTPHATHYEVAKAALEADLHVLVEKPMTLFARDARELLRLAGERGRVVSLGYAHNFTQNILRGHEVVAGGELGEVHYLECSFCSDMTGFLGGNVTAENPVRTRAKVHGPGEAYNRPELMGGGHGHLQLTHGIGVLFYVTGLGAKVVQARMSKQGRAVDMVDAITVEFENGALGLVGGTGTAKVLHRVSLSVFCERGAFLADTLTGTSGLRRADGSREELTWQPLMNTRYGTTHNFLDVVLGRATSYAPGEVGWRAVELLDAAYRSVQQGGQPVMIKDLY
jgi:predicted dehydrogenase